VTYIIDKVDYFMIGSLIGAKTLGAYKLAFQIATLPRQVFYGILNRVLFPFYSAFLANGNKDRIIAVHKQLMRMFAFFAVPLFIGLATIADHFVLSVLGKKWEEMIPMLGLLLINFMVTLLSDFNSAIYLSSGRTKLQFYLSIFLRLDIILFIVVGIYIGGVQGLLIGFLLAKIINFFPFTYFASRIMGYTIWDIMRNFTPMFLSGFFMFIVLQMGKWLIFTHPGNVLELVGLVAMGALSYLAALAIFRKEIFEEVFRLVWSTRRAVEADGG
jgi:PST family polysaccharide transporter